MGQIKNIILRICPGSAFYFRYENLYEPAQNLIRSSSSVLSCQGGVSNCPQEYHRC